MRIHIVSGFLGAGKTTLINKWLPFIEGKVCLIENEFGDISVDGRLFPNHLQVKEIYAGCICCNLVGSFREGIKEIYEIHKPDHLIIEPSGVGALSEVLKVCHGVVKEYPQVMTIGNVYTIVDATAFREYADNFGAFYLDQVKSASMVLFSYSNQVEEILLNQIHNRIKTLNQRAHIVTEDWLIMEDFVFETYMNLEHEKRINPLDKKTVSVEGILKSFSIGNPRVFTAESFEKVFSDLDDVSNGSLIRAKGVVRLSTGECAHFDYTPFHKEWRIMRSQVKPGIAFIGKRIDEGILRKKFSKRMFIKSSKGDLINEIG